MCSDVMFHGPTVFRSCHILWDNMCSDVIAVCMRKLVFRYCYVSRDNKSSNVAMSYGNYEL